MAVDIRDALVSAREHLGLCMHALSYFEKLDESYRKMGVSMIIQTGRAITYGFEELSKHSPKFANWYGPHNAHLHSNTIFKYFRELRNIIVHRSGRIDLNHVSVIPVHDPQPGAIEALVADGSTVDHMSIDFIGNRRYLVVRTPDGRMEERDVPQRREGAWWQLVDIRSFFRDAPVEFAGVTVIESCEQYVRFLEQIVADAETTFGC